MYNKLLLIVIYSSSVFSCFSQCILTIHQNGKITDTLTIKDYNQPPLIINDSTLEFKYDVISPVCLFIIIDKQTRWFTRVWINPEIKHKDLIIDYSKKTSFVKNGNEWDNIMDTVLPLEIQGKEKEEDSISAIYVIKNPDSYFSLYLLSHGLYYQDRKKRIEILNLLSPSFSNYPEYRQMKADLTGRKYPNYGDTFKEFTLNNQNDKPFSSSSINNKIIILHFWSTGCGPCVKGMDAMVNFYKSLDTSKIAFISISLDEDKGKWKKSTTANKIIWTNLWTEDNSYCDLCLNYNLTAMPYFVMFNKEKKITFYNAGEDIELLKSKLKEIEK